MNPYAPPQTVVEAPASPLPGVLWHVSAGKLHVRAGASLPDVCLLGSPDHESGIRRTFKITWSPLWVRYLPALPFLGWLAWAADRSLGPRGIVAMVIATMIFSLPEIILAKRCKVHAFVSSRARARDFKRAWGEGLIGFAVAVAAGYLIRQVFPGIFGNGGAAGMAIGVVAGVVMMELQQQRKVRAIRHQDGWFNLTNVHPAAIARLQAIQHRATPPTGSPLSGLTPPAGSTTARRGSG